MNNPFPGINVSFKVDAFNIKILDTENQNIERYGLLEDITNYQYEVQKNEEKRKILILKPEYLQAFLSDMRNIMKYSKSSQYINDTTKRVYNSKLKGV